jgi:hypothetical protein
MGDEKRHTCAMCWCHDAETIRADERAKVVAREAAALALLTDALDFIADNEWGGWMSDGPVDVISTCLDCGAQKGEKPEENQAHSENCRWLAIMRRSGRAR